MNNQDNNSIQNIHSTADEVQSYDPITGYRHRLTIEFRRHNFSLETVLMHWFEFPPSRFQDFLLKNNYKYARVSRDWAECVLLDQPGPELHFMYHDKINYVEQDHYSGSEIYPYVVVTVKWWDQFSRLIASQSRNL
jgi:hypothetical protein